MEDLQTLRNRLVGLVESFELDDPSTGIMAWVPVVGGTFVHPLTRAKIERFLVYGASQNQVKILEPKFLRSLPLIDVSGISHPSQLCAIAARALGEILGRLGKIRQEVAVLGINLDLEHDLLRLRGVLEIDGSRVQIAAADEGQLIIMAIEERYCGSVERSQRTIQLTDHPEQDLVSLRKRVQEIRESWQNPLESQTSEQTAAVPIPQVPKVDLGSGWGEIELPKPRPVASTVGQDAVARDSNHLDSKPPVTLLSPQSHASSSLFSQEVIEPLVVEPSQADELTQTTEGQTDVASQPTPEPSAIGENPVQIQESEPEQAGASIEGEQPRIQVDVEPSVLPVGPEVPLHKAPAPGLDESQEESPVVELTELVDDKKQSDEIKESPAFGTLRVDRLFEITGGDTEVSANGGRLRLKIPFRVVQGNFVFFLEQVGGTQFTGFLESPSGSRHNVDLDFQAIMDIKEVFDRVMLGT